MAMGWKRNCLSDTTDCNRLESHGEGSDYNSDVDLIMGLNDSLYVFWRHWHGSCSGSSACDMIKVSASGDGKTWTSPAISYQDTVVGLSRKRRWLYKSSSSFKWLYLSNVFYG